MNQKMFRIIVCNFVYKIRNEIIPGTKKTSPIHVDMHRTVRVWESPKEFGQRRIYR